MRTLTLTLTLLPFLLGNTNCGAPAAAAPVPDAANLHGGSSPSYPHPTMDDCFPIAPLVCGEVIHDDTSDVNAGTTTVVDGWPLAVGNYAGPEIAYVIEAAVDGTIDVSLEDASPTLVNHDLFVLDAALGCRPEATIATGFSGVEVEVTAGHRYYVVVDGFDGDAGPFSARVGCDDAAIAPPHPSLDPPQSDEAARCAFGESTLEAETADWLVLDERVEEHLSPESMSALRRAQLRAGWAEATNSEDPADLVFQLAGPGGVWVDTLTMAATGETFTWLRFLQGGSEIPFGFLFRAGSTELVAYDLDTGWMTCTVEAP